MLANGIHPGLTMRDYLAAPALSSGVLHTLITRSPLHAAYEQSAPSEDTVATDKGSAAHAILLEGSEACIVVCDFTDWRKNEAKAMRDDARAGRKIPLLASQMDEIRRMVDAAKNHIEASAISNEWARGISEQSVKWEDGGIVCKSRYDRVNTETDVIFDYKTCGGSVNPKDWSRQVISMGYDIQAAFYQRGYRAIHGRDARFVWLAQETEAPYACCWMDMGPDLQAYANSRVERGMAMWAKAIKSGKWPGYPKQVCSLEVPQWAMAAEENEQIFGAYDELQAKEGIQP